MKWLLALTLFLSSWLAWGRELRAHDEPKHQPFGEISLMGSYSKTDYGDNTYSTTRRYAASAGVFVTPLSLVELSYTNTSSFFNQNPIQTANVNEQVLGLSLVQALVPEAFIVQPYGKIGAAQYNRQQSGTIDGIPTTPISTQSPSAILGAGCRVFLLRGISLKLEVVTFLPNLHIGEAKNNFTAQGGFGWEF